MTLFEIAEELITDEQKRAWLRSYLSDQSNMDTFMAKWLEKSVAEAAKQKPVQARPPKIQ